jgi:phosphate/sulfate permease
MSKENDIAYYAVMVLFLIVSSAIIVFSFAFKEPAIALWFLIGAIIGYWIKCIGVAIEEKEND